MSRASSLSSRKTWSRALTNRDQSHLPSPDIFLIVDSLAYSNVKENLNLMVWVPHMPANNSGSVRHENNTWHLFWVPDTYKDMKFLKHTLIFSSNLDLTWLEMQQIAITSSPSAGLDQILPWLYYELHFICGRSSSICQVNNNSGGYSCMWFILFYFEIIRMFAHENQTWNCFLCKIKCAISQFIIEFTIHNPF